MLCSPQFNAWEAAVDYRPRKSIHVERILAKLTVRKNRAHLRPLLITFCDTSYGEIPLASISWRKLYFGARFHFLRSGKVKLYNIEIAGKIRLNEEKDYMSTGNPSPVTHSAGLLATLPVLKNTRLVYNLPEGKRQSLKAIRIETSLIITYRAYFKFFLLYSEIALFKAQWQIILFTGFISKKNTLKHHNKIKC